MYEISNNGIQSALKVQLQSFIIWQYRIYKALRMSNYTNNWNWHAGRIHRLHTKSTRINIFFNNNVIAANFFFNDKYQMPKFLCNFLKYTKLPNLPQSPFPSKYNYMYAFNTNTCLCNLKAIALGVIIGKTAGARDTYF